MSQEKPDGEVPEGTPKPEGGDLSNTPPSTRHLETGGEDTVDVSVRVNWTDFGKLVEQMDIVRESAGAPDAPLEDRVVVDGKRQPYLIDSMGHKVGGSKGPYYRWRLERNGIRLDIQDQELAHLTMPNVMVHLGSLPLMARGLASVWEETLDCLGALGAEVVEDKLSRVDPAVDLAAVPVEILADLFRRQCFVSRARKSGQFASGEFATGMNSTGFTFGADQCRVRVYDKLLEVRTSGSKMAVLLFRRWGGLPECATRVEFQLRRERLRELQVATVNEWLLRRAGVVDYLCDDWFRLTKEVPDRENRNTARCEMADVWKTVRQAFVDWAGRGPTAKRTPLPPAIAGQALVLQAIGCFVRFFVEQGKEIDHNDEFTTLLLDEIEGFFKEGHEMPETMRAKRFELESKGLVLPLSEPETEEKEDEEKKEEEENPPES
ncbi:MAG: hypothetical protein NTW19_07835 [Planctomycetota bacterium]|nr:hypothetical protein [Planctomycetota bacterium]